MNNITFLIPSFNRIEFLNNLIMSIQKYCSAGYEIIVIDDGSTISYESIRRNNVKYIRLENNCGKNKAILEGLKQVKTKYICILDDKQILCGDIVKKIDKVEIRGSEIIGIDLIDNKKKLVGDSLIINMKIKDFYFNERLVGDKCWIFLKEIININLLESLIVYGELSYDDCYWTQFIWNSKIIKSLSNMVINEYLTGGVTDRYDYYWIMNPYTSINICNIYLSVTNISRRIKELFKIWTIRKIWNIDKIKINKYSNKILWYLLFFPFCLFGKKISFFKKMQGIKNENI